MFTPSAPWYKHGAGRAFLIFLAIIGLIAASFGTLVAYYLWHYNQGTFATVEKKLYEGRQSTLTGAAQQPKNPTIADPTKLIRAHNPTIGETDAPITVIMFIDFECPFCQADYASMQKIRDQYAGVARFVFKHFPVEAIHPNARTAAMAAACAAEEGKFWPYYDHLFQNKNLSEHGLATAATALNIKTPRFDSCRSTYRTAKFIEEDVNDAYAIGIRGTPTYIVNGTRIDGSIPESEWQRIMVEALKTPATKP